MPDHELKIAIIMDLIGQGKIAEAKTGLSDLKESMTGTSQAAEDLTEKEKTGTEASEKFHLSHQESAKVLRELGGQVIPGAGRALAELRLRLIGVALAGVEVFGLVREHIKKTNEELDALGEKANEAFSNVKTNLIDAIETHQFSTANVDRYFTKIEEDANKAKKAIEDALAITREKGSAKEEELKSQQELSLAQFRASPQYAGMSAAQRATGEQNIKDNFARQIADAQKAGVQADFDASYQRMREAEAEKYRLEGMKKNIPVDADMQKRINEYMASLPQNDVMRQEFEAAQKSGKVDYAGIINQFQSTDFAAQLKTMQEKLGMDEQTKAVTGGDAKRAKDLHEKFDEQIGGWREQLDTLETFRKNNPNMPGSQREGVENQIKILQDKIAGTGVEQADAAVKADQARIEQLRHQERILKEQSESQEKLNNAIDKARLAFEAAWAEMEKAGQIADIKNKSIDTTTGNKIAASDLNTAAGIIAGQDPNAIISAGVAAADDLKRLRDQGYTADKIQKEGNQALKDRENGRSFNAGAIARLEQFNRDKSEVENLNRLLQTMGQNSHAMVEIIHHHTSGQRNLAETVRDLANFYAGVQRDIGDLKRTVQALASPSGLK